MKTTRAELHRIENAPKLCHSDLLDCNICFDSGADTNHVPSALLAKWRERGFVIDPADSVTRHHYSDGSSELNDKSWLINLPLSADFWYRGVFYESCGEYLVIGKDLMKRVVMSYTRESIALLKEYPYGYDAIAPLVERDRKYYVSLKVNGRVNDYYLDTGHSDALALPLDDRQHAISPIREIDDYLRILGRKKKIHDYEEERGCLEIASVTRHGPIVYADYYNEPYWFNPAIIFADFVLDLKNRIIGFKK